LTTRIFFQLSFFYFLYNFYVGLIVPYWGPYLSHNHFSPLKIGMYFAVFQVGRIIAPLIWGYFADKTNNRILWVRLISILGLLGFCTIFIEVNSFTILFVMLSMSFFTSSTNPLIESLTLMMLSSNKANYSYTKIRIWGSIGFIFSSVFLGFLIDKFSIYSLIIALLINHIFLLIHSFCIQDCRIKDLSINKRPFFGLFKNKQIIILLVSCLLMVTAHGIYYNFFSLFLVKFNYSGSMIGFLWATGVICEIIMFLFFYKLHKFIDLKKIILLSLFFAFIRFILLGFFTENIFILFLAQSMHAFTFGSFHVASIMIIEHFFYKEHHSRGQSLYNSIAYGMGGAIGGLVGGICIEQLGYQITFGYSAFLPFLAFFIFMFGIKDYPKMAK
jgi:PPP family 3-phenylpropionic acid transporter